MSNESEVEFAVIFDVDGVLINSLEMSTRVTKQVLAEYGVDFDKLIDPSGGNHYGNSGRTIVKLIKDQFGVDIDLDEFLKKRIPTVVKELRDGGITADKNLVKFLEDLKSHNIPIASASSGIRIVTETKLEVLGIDKYIKVLITSDDVANHKPHPEPYLTVAKLLNIDPSKCVVVEDSLQGVTAAEAAGMKIVAFTKHNKSHDSYNSVKPNLVVNDWDKLSYSVVKGLVEN